MQESVNTSASILDDKLIAEVLPRSMLHPVVAPIQVPAQLFPEQPLQPVHDAVLQPVVQSLHDGNVEPMPGPSWQSPQEQANVPTTVSVQVPATPSTGW